MIEQQNIQMIDLSDFTGGMNSAVPPQALAPNEYQLIKNMEFNFNKLVTRGGLSAPIRKFAGTITKIFYRETSNTCLVAAKTEIEHNIYFDDFVNPPVLLGQLTGWSKPAFCEFDGNVA